jgi:hypothetical protein
MREEREKAYRGLVDRMYPVGWEYCGDSPPSHGEWEDVYGTGRVWKRVAPRKATGATEASPATSNHNS